MPAFTNDSAGHHESRETHDRVQAAFKQHHFEQQLSLAKFLEAVAHIYDRPDGASDSSSKHALANAYVSESPTEAEENGGEVQSNSHALANAYGIIPHIQHSIGAEWWNDAQKGGSPRTPSPECEEVPGKSVKSGKSWRSEQSRTLATIRVHVNGASGLRAADWHFFSKGTSDPYCVCEMRGRKSRFQTNVVSKTLNPKWYQVFEFTDVGGDEDLLFSVYDHDWSKTDDFLGKVELHTSSFLPDGFEGELKLEDSGVENAMISVRVEVILEVVEDAYDRRKMKLTKWWSALVGNSDPQTSMSTKKLATIVAQTQHPTDRLSADAIDNVLASFICKGSEADYSLMKQEDGNDLTFFGFTSLILWRGAQQFAKRRVHPDLIRDAYIVRDSLVKAAADRMIAKHARLYVHDEDTSSKSSFLGFLEPVAGAVILLNGITIGMSADTADWDGWPILEIFFTAFFLFEIMAKLHIKGSIPYFFGPDCRWNIFDSVVVGFALADVFMTNFLASNDSFLRDFTLVRMTRLARLSRLMRLLRLLRLKVFKELLLMIKGIYAGIRTLFWAVVLLLLIVYAVSMVLRQTVGEAGVSFGGRELFTTVFSTMFTVFRVFMGDTALVDGTPLALKLYMKYGVGFAAPYCLVILFIVFGIFNMIAALFVENVIATANAKKTLTITGERIRVARKLRFLLLKFAGHEQGVTGKVHAKSITQQVSDEYNKRMGRWCTVGRCLRRFCQRTTRTLRMSRVEDEGAWESKWFDLMAEGSPSSGLDTVVTRSTFTRIVYEQEVQDAFDDLEIYTADRGELFDVLDADGSGELDLSELISGLMKLRSSGGDRSDAVATVLGIKSMQSAIAEMKECFKEIMLRTPLAHPSCANVAVRRGDSVEDVQFQFQPHRNGSSASKTQDIPLLALENVTARGTAQNWPMMAL